MSLRTGTIVSLEVAREVSPYGYFLTDGERDVLLHYTEKTADVRPGDRVKVFLYADTEDRLAATMKRPLLLLGEVGLLEVVDIHPRFGLFLEMGIGRNLLLPFRELPELKALRPQIGDHVYVVMKQDKQGRLLAKMAGEKELAPLTVPAPESWKGTWVAATVYKSLQAGTFAVCGAGPLGFGALGMIHATERTRPLRVGETVEARVIGVREEDGRANLSMRQPKHIGRGEDAEKIVAFLRSRPNGAMPYSDDTPADLIMQKFGISKGAFKRALGKLMKDGVVVQRENWTYLQESDAAAGSKDGQS